MSVTSILLIALIAGALGAIAYRDHRRRERQRYDLLSECARLFDTHTVVRGDDKFPRIEGVRAGRRFDVRLIADGMTIRRLPQLWLQVTELADLDGASGLAVLVRPSGYEFFSLTTVFEHVIEVPSAFPREVIVRGENETSDPLFETLARPIAGILKDPCIKEVAVTRRGLRIIRQADEGRRGDYLLLRQAAFDRASVAAETLSDIVNDLETLRSALAPRDLAHA